jgi:ATP-dependent Clp protease ATP-binding subunit ClpC
VRQVTRRLLARTAEALLDRHITLAIDDSAIDWLLDHGGYDITLGARPMKRTLARFVEAPLAEQILSGALVGGMTAHLCVVDGEVRTVAR